MSTNPDPVDVEVGRRLAALRISRGFNQSDLGRSVGKTFQQIQKYEKGSNRVSCSVLFKFARFLGVQPGYFFPDSDPAASGLPESATAAMSATRNGQELARLFVGMGDDHRAALIQCARALNGPALQLAA